MSTDDLMRPEHHFPLSAALDPDMADPNCNKNGLYPFGLRYVIAPAESSVVEVDFSRISYDPVQQISVILDDDGSLLPAMKHTSTTTKTSTASHDRKGDDADTDSTGR